MIEIKGELWDFYKRPNHIICITTNGYVKKNGEAVCGRGCAREACDKIITFAALLGWYIKKYGNVPGYLVTELDNSYSVFIYPVKHKWDEIASKSLILAAAHVLFEQAKKNPSINFILPRPGCGNGNLKWHEVKELIEFLPDNVYVITKAIKGVI